MVSLFTSLSKHTHKLPLLITLLFSVFCLANFIVSGPHWLHQNGDVNYTYLLTGLDYWSLLPSGINDQPAITVKLWNAIVIGALYLIRLPFINLSLEQDVIANSELYLNIITLSVYLVLAYSLYRFLKFTFYSTKSKILWLLAACSFFLSSVIFSHLWVNKPEPYLVIAGLWVSWIVLKLVRKKNVSTPNIIAAVLFSVLSKITIAPFILPLLILIPRKQLLKRILPWGLLLFLAITTIWRNELQPFISWIANAGSHSGAYGTGEVGFYNQSIIENIYKTLWINKLLICVLMGGIAYSFIKKVNRPAIISFAISYLVFFLIILKMPTSSYFLVCFIFAPTFILLAFEGLIITRYKHEILIIIAAFILVRFGLYSRDIRKKNMVAITFDKPIGVQTYYTSSKEYALLLANKTQFDRHSDLLHQHYPDVLFYWFDNHFYNFNGKIPHENLVNQELLLTGTSDYIEKDTAVEILLRNNDGINYQYEIIIKN